MRKKKKREEQEVVERFKSPLLAPPSAGSSLRTPTSSHTTSIPPSLFPSFPDRRVHPCRITPTTPLAHTPLDHGLPSFSLSHARNPLLFSLALSLGHPSVLARTRDGFLRCVSVPSSPRRRVYLILGRRGGRRRGGKGGRRNGACPVFGSLGPPAL
jgi:hypothetical protein